MSIVYFISDLHLGHRTIMRHTRDVEGAFRGDPDASVAEHDEWVMEQLLSVRADKHTLWWILGDVAMEVAQLELLRALPGRKRLMLGNHDLFQTPVYLKHFESVHGTIKKYGMWLSHVPVHEVELRGIPNVHGHCHHDSLKHDSRYLNVAIEWVQHPLSLEQVRSHFDE
jgi:calcineurin-like phosphoesterase family protein